MFLTRKQDRRVQLIEQVDYTTQRKKHKHILLNDRYTIEQMLESGYKAAEISKVVGCNQRTIRREITRGTWKYLDGQTYNIEMEKPATSYRKLRRQTKGESFTKIP